MNKIFYKTVIVIGVLLATGCNSFLDPDPDNVRQEEDVLKNPELAEGVLLNAYKDLPVSNSFTDVATDDAVSNLTSNSYRLITNGEWKSTNNPFDMWGKSYTNIAYTNMFLDEIVNNVEWSYSSEWQNEHFRKRLTAEARGLRAFYYIMLLEAHAGIGASSGTLLGVPMIMTSINIDGNLTVPRESYDRCVEILVDELDAVIEALPDSYEAADNSDPQKQDKDAVYGAKFKNRLSGRVAKMLKARLLLHAASPAFNPADDKTKWVDAADAAAVVIDVYGGLSALIPERIEYYLNENVTDNLWRKDFSNIRGWETTNFPPSLYGTGRTNPSQNIVDAFPADNGYPITMTEAGYNVSQPYANRDKRLFAYVIYNGMTFKTKTINTIDDPNDGIDKVASSSTRTGYYIKKLMDEKVSLTPGAGVSTRHFMTLMRHTEAFLIYAEAACNAWGRSGMGTHAYSATDVIAKLRQTAGISQPDKYLASISDDDTMLDLIRNERRLELSFESRRFWDLRRWADLDKMNETARGTYDGGATSANIETRKYADYMIYGPIPYSESRKGLEQNKGWN